MLGLEVLLAQGLALWIIAIGFAMMLGGPRAAGAVARWLPRTLLRLVRRLVGGLLTALGSWIRGR